MNTSSPASQPTKRPSLLTRYTTFATSIAAPSAIKEFRIAHKVLAVLGILFIILSILPIIMIINDARGTADVAGANVGMVVFSYIFLAPVSALSLLGWFAIPALVLCILGKKRSPQKLTFIEKYLFFTSVLFVLISIVTIRFIPDALFILVGPFIS